MKLRRYYPKGFQGKTYSDKYLSVLKEKGVNTDVVDTASYELLLSSQEQQQFFERTCSMILNNTRWVLDNLEYLQEYQVNWENYHKKGYWKGKKPKPL